MDILITVGEYLLSHGREYPKANENNSIPSNAFAKANLPMVVACSNCEMTMACHEYLPCTRDGIIYCDDCAGVLES
jgi:hypothetical protein